MAQTNASLIWKIANKVQKHRLRTRITELLAAGAETAPDQR